MGNVELVNVVSHLMKDNVVYYGERKADAHPNFLMHRAGTGCRSRSGADNRHNRDYDCEDNVTLFISCRVTSCRPVQKPILVQFTMARPRKTSVTSDTSTGPDGHQVSRSESYLSISS